MTVPKLESLARQVKGNLLFLGGTCGNNTWRKTFTKKLLAMGVDKEVIFDPVVDDWNAEAQKAEEAAKKKASHHLYYLADPQQPGNPMSFYSAVEATMALYDREKKTVVIFDDKGIKGQFLKAFNQMKDVLQERFPKAAIFDDLDDALKWLGKELI